MTECKHSQDLNNNELNWLESVSFIISRFKYLMLAGALGASIGYFLSLSQNLESTFSYKLYNPDLKSILIERFIHEQLEVSSLTQTISILKTPSEDYLGNSIKKDFLYFFERLKIKGLKLTKPPRNSKSNEYIPEVSSQNAAKLEKGLIDITNKYRLYKEVMFKEIISKRLMALKKIDNALTFTNNSDIKKSIKLLEKIEVDFTEFRPYLKSDAQLVSKPKDLSIAYIFVSSIIALVLEVIILLICHSYQNSKLCSFL